ncbi:MAG: 50S ribosomal protein L3 [Fimbriimonadales bacterium]|jgi:large subunit ribosomal protein L3|nr:50S ribosomal protein L3 [Armatimonadota bacterium]MCX7687750.1 50S ribosomal protein L3 [Fimbriimonadales bacterium]CUU04522.1 large subunit ribosomal protein L3 [Armatimonadetes bacterium GBS]CUU37692.1 large subunit ribosomal protein L3 [Armatimonadetes bacterium DC]CUU38859.1 large subunit ribosomal protein L3 [Armatimonadetes bacterium GXS]GBC90628.1 50S ribosomal protein L3 [bacterium HR14]
MSNEEKSPQETVAPETAPEVTPEAQEAVAAEQPEAAQTEAAESQSEAAESQLAAAAEAPAPAKRELPPPPVITGLIGRKLGMTHIFDEQGRMVAVTAVELGPCYVVQVRTPERDGYLAVQVGFGEQKRQRVNKPMQGIFRKAELPRPLRYLREFRVIEGQPASGQEIRAEHVFQVGEIVKVTGTSKGKGFAGVVRRYGFAGGPKTHGSMTHRRPLSSGATGPQRVFKGKTMPGRMGGERVTTRGLTIVAIKPEQNLVLIKGSVPGGKGSIVYVQKQQ